MSLNRDDQRRLEAALADNPLKDKLMDEWQAMRDAFNATLAKLDLDAGVTDQNFQSTLEIEDIADNSKRTRF